MQHCKREMIEVSIIHGIVLNQHLSSPRAKRSGPKVLRAESARAVTGRRCPHSGKGEDILTGQPDFFTKTAKSPERKVENRSQGGKLTVMVSAKNGS